MPVAAKHEQQVRAIRDGVVVTRAGDYPRTVRVPGCERLAAEVVAEQDVAAHERCHDPVRPAGRTQPVHPDLTSVVSAPAMNPAGSKTISAGMCSRLASTCEPTASTRMRPIPNRIWSVVMAGPEDVQA